MKGLRKTVICIITAIFIMLSLSSCALIRAFEGLGGMSFGDTKYPVYNDGDRYSIGNFTYSFTDITSLEISWVASDLEIIESDKPLLSVSENGSDLPDEEKLHYLLDGNTLKIQYCESSHKGKIDEKFKHLTVEIPADVSLVVSSMSADIRFGVLNVESLTVSTMSGDISAEEIRSENNVVISTMSGDLNAETLLSDGKIAVSTMSGDITSHIMNSANDFEIITESGDVHMSKLSSGDDLEISTMSGNVTLESVVLQGDLICSTMSGDTTVGTADVSSEIEISTMSGGVELGLLSAKEVECSTMSGDFVLKNIGGLSLQYGGISKNRLDTSHLVQGNGMPVEIDFSSMSGKAIFR